MHWLLNLIITLLIKSICHCSPDTVSGWYWNRLVMLDSVSCCFSLICQNRLQHPRRFIENLTQPIESSASDNQFYFQVRGVKMVVLQGFMVPSVTDSARMPVPAASAIELWASVSARPDSLAPPVRRNAQKIHGDRTANGSKSTITSYCFPSVLGSPRSQALWRNQMTYIIM